MDVKKIKTILEKFQNVVEEEGPKNSEFILSVANLLRIFALAHIVADANNFGLQLMLQVHVLIKMSEGFSDSPEIEK